ncbi:hypothetical protein RM780_10590 [Streptomyces sp. DSM 44917]|uniref:Phosphodiesterase n=1 Tax=Streptomyces boetiae TaxID=3075541 RepID=A0ABU2L7C8_9ACTN|nr:hypothetical protein [Streptomyces sp. DSM 44917]MDT0307410.1 hypothetical protein [Streptomyces sp. DSM 44917]
MGSWMGLAGPSVRGEAGAVWGAERRRGARTVMARVVRDLPPGGTAGGYREARRAGVRAFTLRREGAGGELLARVRTPAAEGARGMTYEVVGADGRPLALIRREPLAFPRRWRARWTVLPQGSGGFEATGWTGGRLGWWLWLPTVPAQVALAFAAEGEFTGAGPSQRVRLRSGGRVVADHRPGASRMGLPVPGWDPAVAAALLVLLESWVPGRRRRPAHPDGV